MKNTTMTIKRSLITVVFIAVLAALLPACGASGAATLRDTAWELESLTGRDLLPGTTITLKFEGEQISGSAGCNQYGGSYQAGENNLSVGNVFFTEMGCMEPEGIMDQEIAYLTALGSAATYQINADRLKVYNNAGTQILVFVVSSLELE